MKIVIIGAGSMAFAPALLGGFSRYKRFAGATMGLVDVNEASLDVIQRLAQRLSDEWDLHWDVRASTERRDVLDGANIVTTSIGVGGLDAFALDLEIPTRYGCVQPVGDTSGPGGLSRALRHIPVLLDVARDMEELCPEATLYNFTNPLTVLTQAVNSHTEITCVGLCIGVDLTWNHLCRVLGVDKTQTSIVAAGINHCHWILDFRLGGQDAYPILEAALDELDGDAAAMKRLRKQYDALADQPQEAFKGTEPISTALYRQLGYYPGPGDWHVAEFFPQFLQSTRDQRAHFNVDQAYLRRVQEAYPRMMQKMSDMADDRAPLDEAIFGEELAWEHTQLLDLLAAEHGDLREVLYVNVPNRGCIHNLPDDLVVEVPAQVDAAGLHPFAIGDLPAPVLPTLARAAASLDLIIEAALEGSRRKAVQAFLNDPYCIDIDAGKRMIEELIDAQLPYLPAFE